MVLMESRIAKKDDMKFIMSLAENEGWNPGLNDGACFFSADSQGFFIGEVDGTPIGCISAIKYNGFGFIGLYIIEKTHRGKGYGLALWNRATSYLQGCNVGLDGVVDQQDNYKMSGFRLAYRNIRFEGARVGEGDPKFDIGTNHHILNAQRLPFDQLLEYDKRHFPAARRSFLQSWLSMSKANSLAYVEKGQIKGLGTIRQCSNGYKIGPLYAETPEIAEQLFCHLAKYAQGDFIYLDVSEENSCGIQLAEKYQMKPIFETARMYTGERPQLLDREVFGITTFELG